MQGKVPVIALPQLHESHVFFNGLCVLSWKAGSGSRRVQARARVASSASGALQCHARCTSRLEDAAYLMTCCFLA